MQILRRGDFYTFVMKGVLSNVRNGTTSWDGARDPFGHHLMYGRAGIPTLSPASGTLFIALLCLVLRWVQPWPPRLCRRMTPLLSPCSLLQQQLLAVGAGIQGTRQPPAHESLPDHPVPLFQGNVKESTCRILADLLEAVPSWCLTEASVCN